MSRTRLDRDVLQEVRDSFGATPEQIARRLGESSWDVEDSLERLERNGDVDSWGREWSERSPGWRGYL